MSEEISEESKLYLPHFCIVPLSVRQDKEIPAEAKLYLGELSALSNKYGYCFASDEALAEMKQVDIRTIKRWHEILEERGHIKRDTKNIPIQNKDGKFQWRTSRKIFITSLNPQGEIQNSKNVCGSDKNVPPIGGDKNVPPIGGDKNVPRNKELSNAKQSNQQQEEPSAAVVFSEKLSKVDIPLKEKRWLVNKYPMEVIDKAVDYSKNVEISTSLVQVLKWACKEQPEIPKSKEETVIENKRYAESLNIKETNGIYMEILSQFVEIVYSGCQKESLVIKYTQKNFKNLLSKHLKENNMILGEG